MLNQDSKLTLGFTGFEPKYPCPPNRRAGVFRFVGAALADVWAARALPSPVTPRCLNLNGYCREPERLIFGFD